MLAFSILVNGPCAGMRIPRPTTKERAAADYTVAVPTAAGGVAIYRWDRDDLVFRFHELDGDQIPHRLD